MLLSCIGRRSSSFSEEDPTPCILQTSSSYGTIGRGKQSWSSSSGTHISTLSLSLCVLWLWKLRRSLRAGGRKEDDLSSSLLLSQRSSPPLHPLSLSIGLQGEDPWLILSERIPGPRLPSESRLVLDRRLGASSRFGEASRSEGEGTSSRAGYQTVWLWRWDDLGRGMGDV